MTGPGKFEEICRVHNVVPDPPSPMSKVGVALASLRLDPLNGLRHAPQADTCGWYIWGGDFSDDPEFFQPVHVHHLAEACPDAIPFLALPPGWRFLLGRKSYTDVWSDPSLLDVRNVMGEARCTGSG